MEFIASSLFMVAIYVMLATSFNLIIGFAGLMSIAHPIFFALGAYGSGLIARELGLPIALCLVGGAMIAGLASIALSLPSLRVSGDYLVIASIGFQLGLLQIIKNVDFTGGPGGFSNIKPLFASHGTSALLGAAAIAWACAFGAVALVRWLTGGPYGRAITAMRDDEEAFAGLGRKAVQIKVTLFAIACAVAGLAGGLYAHNYQFVAPEQFDIVASATILTMVVVGGVRTVWGPVCGAILLQLLPQLIHFLELPPSVTGPLQGLIFTGLVLTFLFVRPGGLLGAATVPRGPVVTNKAGH
jgi:branched-chain amino acid transport system permease protein